MEDIIKKRKLWSQQEVLAIAKHLGLKDFTKQKLLYWRNEQKAFPQPIIKTSAINFYKTEDVINGFLAIVPRFRQPIDIDRGLVVKTMVVVLEQVKDYNANKFRKYMNQHGQ